MEEKRASSNGNSNGHLSDERIVHLDIDRKFRMDFNALAKAEEATGKNFLSTELWRDLSARDYRALAWACMLDEDPSLTLEQAGKLITMRNEAVVTKALTELYVSHAAAPIDDKETAEAPFTLAGGGERQ